jgi:hypothetical protein
LTADKEAKAAASNTGAVTVMMVVAKEAIW